MDKILVETTNGREIVDITDRIEEMIQIKNGLVNLFVTHTTAALTTADLDPGTDQDLLRAYEEMVPNLKYNHPHNPQHVWRHIMASVIGPSLNVPIINGMLVLGTWQRIILVEFNGPRNRKIQVSFFSSDV